MQCTHFLYKTKYKTTKLFHRIFFHFFYRSYCNRMSNLQRNQLKWYIAWFYYHNMQIYNSQHYWKSWTKARVSPNAKNRSQGQSNSRFFLMLWWGKLLARSIWWYKPTCSERSRFIYINCHVALCIVRNQLFLEFHSPKEYWETLILLLQTIQKLLTETGIKTVNIIFILKLF